MVRSYFHFLILFVVAASPAVAIEQTVCGDSMDVTELDISSSTVLTNTLHMENGEMRYQNVGEFDGKPLDLVVTNPSGEYTKIATVWEEKGKDASKNGKMGGFANINLQTVAGDTTSGLADFEVCIVDQVTNQPVKIDAFHFSVSDIDQRGMGEDTIQEQLLIDISQAHSFQMWPNEEGSEVGLSCSDGTTELPCNAGIQTIFHSTSWGTGQDRVTNPEDMMDTQLKRTVELTFVNTDCFQFSYDLYCPSERADNPTMCKYYCGGNFQFSMVGSVTSEMRASMGADIVLADIVEDGECFTPL